MAVKNDSLSKKRTRRKQSIKKAKGGPASLTIEVRPSHKRRVYNNKHRKEEEQIETFYGIGTDEQEEHDGGNIVGTSRQTRQQKKKSDAASKGTSGTNARATDRPTEGEKKEAEDRQDGAQTGGSEDDLVLQLKKQLDLRDQEMALLKRQADESQTILKTMQTFLISKGFMPGAEQQGEQPKGDAQSTQATPSLTKEDIKELIANQLQMAGESSGLPPFKRTVRPYPPAFDAIPYPTGYTVPKFKMFTGEGPKMISPDQHLAHFIATCGNTSGNDALLLRQFPQSLGGSAFEWYYSLENGSIKSWDDMMDAFRAKFAVASDRVGIADLASTKPKKGEPILEYINRWRNLSIRCERSISQSEAVDLLLKNIDNWMTWV